MEFEIYWDDLTEEAKERLKPLHDENDDLFPLAVIEREDEEENEPAKAEEAG